MASYKGKKVVCLLHDSDDDAKERQKNSKETADLYKNEAAVARIFNKTGKDTDRIFKNKDTFSPNLARRLKKKKKEGVVDRDYAAYLEKLKADKEKMNRDADLSMEQEKREEQNYSEEDLGDNEEVQGELLFRGNKWNCTSPFLSNDDLVLIGAILHLIGPDEVYNIGEKNFD